jgi:hypothetical protein
VPGTRVQVITKGIFGGDPILIQIGFTRFALRKVEAQKLKFSIRRSFRMSETLRIALVGNPNCGKTSFQSPYWNTPKSCQLCRGDC